MEKIKPVLDNISSYIGLPLDTLTIEQTVKLCEWDFEYSTTVNEKFLVFTVKEFLSSYRDLILLLGKDCEKNLVILHTNDIISGNYTQSNNIPKFISIDGKICLYLSNYLPKDYYVCEDGSITIGKFMWEKAEDMDPTGDFLLNMKYDVAIFLQDLCYAGYITDPLLLNLVKSSREHPF